MFVILLRKQNLPENMSEILYLDLVLLVNYPAVEFKFVLSLISHYESVALNNLSA